MGVNQNISFDIFPKQSDWVGKWVEVCFHYDSSKTIRGQVVRDDKEDPWEMIIQLEDGRYVRSIECQHTLPIEDKSNVQ